MSDSDAADLLIIGAGGFGREVLEYSRAAQAQGWGYRVRGFLDDNPAALVGHRVDLRVVGSCQDMRTGCAYLIALGDPHLRRELAARVAERGGRLATLLAPGAHVAANATIGTGVIVCPSAFVSVESKVGDNALLNVFAGVGHDAEVGAHSVLSPHAFITGGASLGEQCFMGTYAALTPGVRVGRASKVAAGAVVAADAAPGSLLVGNPAHGRVLFPVADGP